MHLDRLLIIAAMAAVTFFDRAAFMVTLGRATLPPWAERSLRYVPVGVLTSLVVPQLVLSGRAWALRPDNPALWGALAAGLVAVRRGSPLLAIIAGVAVVAAIRAL